MRDARGGQRARRPVAHFPPPPAPTARARRDGTRSSRWHALVATARARRDGTRSSRRHALGLECAWLGEHAEHGDVAVVRVLREVAARQVQVHRGLVGGELERRLPERHSHVRRARRRRWARAPTWGRPRPRPMSPSTRTRSRCSRRCLPRSSRTRLQRSTGSVNCPPSCGAAPTRPPRPPARRRPPPARRCVAQAPRTSAPQGGSGR